MPNRINRANRVNDNKNNSITDTSVLFKLTSKPGWCDGESDPESDSDKWNSLLFLICDTCFMNDGRANTLRYDWVYASVRKTPGGPEYSINEHVMSQQVVCINKANKRTRCNNQCKQNSMKSRAGGLSFLQKSREHCHVNEYNSWIHLIVNMMQPHNMAVWRVWSV